MKRELNFIRGGKLADALALDRERCAAFDKIVEGWIREKKSLQFVIEQMNETMDMTDAEWTCFIYSIGHYQGRLGL